MLKGQFWSLWNGGNLDKRREEDLSALILVRPVGTRGRLIKSRDTMARTVEADGVAGAPVITKILLSLDGSRRETRKTRGAFVEQGTYLAVARRN